MEENFSMEWKIFCMEWKTIARMEYGKIIFHSIPYNALHVSELRDLRKKKGKMSILAAKRRPCECSLMKQKNLHASPQFP